MNRFGLLGLALALIGCAPMAVTDRLHPTTYYLDRERQLTKTHVILELDEPADSIVHRVLETSRRCLDPQTESRWTMPAGNILLHGSSEHHWSVETSTDADTRWVALRMDGQFHGVPMALQINALADDKTRVTVYRADARKAATIRQYIASGEILCRFRDVSYPYD